MATLLELVAQAQAEPRRQEPTPNTERPEPRPAPVQPAAQPVAQSVAQPVAAPARTGGFSVKPYNPSPGDEVVPFNRRRQIIADHMVYSKQVSPHVYTFAEIDMHGVSRLRESKKEAYKAEGVSLTFLAFIAAATARLLANGKTESGTLMWTDLGGNGLAHLTEVAVQPDGRVLMGGMVRSATDLDFALLRYVPAPLVATHEQEAPALAVMAYPNPFSHTLRLDLSELPAPVDELWVYALDGRAMFSAQGLSASALDIGAQDWPAGVYVVRAFAAGRCFVQQVLK